MMDYIGHLVASLCQRFGTRDPFQIAESLHIEILFHQLGDYLKGYFFYQSKVKIIIINCELEEEMQRMVCAHELGHSLLHKDLAADHSLNDISLFDMTAKPECEANLFASELLLPDSEVLSRLEEGESFFQVASELYVPPELLDFKFRMLRNRGYQLDAPMVSHGDFLKK